MSRRLLGVIATLGLVISAMSGMGVFATFSDTAHGGNNTVSSGERPTAADLRIEPGALAGTTVNCDLEADNVLWDKQDTTTAQFSASGIQPGSSLGDAYVCLKNVGSASLALTISLVDLADVELGCTGDEAAAGDTSCQPGDPGELSMLLHISTARVDCGHAATTTYTGSEDRNLLSLYPLLSDTRSALAPGEVTCVRISMSYPDPGEDYAQRAQTDQVTWHFEFDGTSL